MAVSSGILDKDRESCSEIAVHVDNTKEVDYLSGLPEDILSCILSLLTMREAVRARVLSRRWRYLSADTSNLLFDLFTVFGITYDQEYKILNNLWEDRLRFVRAVDQMLQLCRSHKIEFFRVRYCLGNEFACYIDRWISFAVRQQTEKLELRFPFIPESCELYSFPCHLFPQGEASQLKCLSLQACVLRPSPDHTSCLNSLIKLRLSDVPLDQSAFDDILSGCINLKFLRHDNCNLPVTFSICRQLHLRYLMLKHCVGAEKIEVFLISLITFEYIGNEICLSLTGVPSLKNVFLKAWPKMNSYMLNGIATDLPRLENLTQELYPRQVVPPTQNMTRLCHLIKLDLMVFLLSDFDFLSVAFIVNAAPQLQKFHLAIQPSPRVKRHVRWECSEQLHYQLKKVEISGFHDHCNSMGLAKYFLKNAVALECMTINSRVRRYRGMDLWEGKYLRKGVLERDRICEVLSKEKVKARVRLIVK